MVTWFKEQFAQLERQQAAERGLQPEQLLEELAMKVPPGSLGLTLQPYWTPGLVHPGPEAKGAIIGFGAAHKKPHMYRALLEGLAYEMRRARAHRGQNQDPHHQACDVVAAPKATWP